MGPKVSEFELAFGRYRAAPHAVAVSSCSAALHLSLLSVGLVAGDEVITTALTFCATVSAIIHAGATPVLADCDRWTMNLTADSIAAKITPRTRAILVVHLCGRPCDMDVIMTLAQHHGLPVIEDCAHAIEASIGGQAVGTIGDFGCFSFYATKNITCAEGGMVLAKNEVAANQVRVLALHGLSKDAWKRFGDTGYRHYDVVSSGFKYNMTDIQAALGLAQLGRIAQSAARRSEIWDTYDRALSGLPCDLPPPPAPGSVHAHHLYTPLLQLERLTVTRDEVLEALTAENIGVGVHYLAIPAFTFFRDTFGWSLGDVPNADFIGERTLSLPLSAGLSDSDVQDVCTAFRRILLHFSR